MQDVEARELGCPPDVVQAVAPAGGAPAKNAAVTEEDDADAAAARRTARSIEASLGVEAALKARLKAQGTLAFGMSVRCAHSTCTARMHPPFSSLLP